MNAGGSMGMFRGFSSMGRGDGDGRETRSPLEKKLIKELQGMLAGADGSGDGSPAAGYGDPAAVEDGPAASADVTPGAPSAGLVRYRLRFTGTVQGVGFRWTNQGAAREVGCTGWVRNLRDGSVEMEIEGAPASIIRHLDMVHASYQRMGARIWLDECMRMQPRGSESFDVRY